MKRSGNPEVIVTDNLRSYGAAIQEIGSVRPRLAGRDLAEHGH
jgi:putative transposase